MVEVAPFYDIGLSSKPRIFCTLSCQICAEHTISYLEYNFLENGGSESWKR